MVYVAELTRTSMKHVLGDMQPTVKTWLHPMGARCTKGMVYRVKVCVTWASIFEG